MEPIHPENIQISSFTVVQSNVQPPKTQCNQYTYHQRSCDHHSTNCTCALNRCTRQRTCFPSYSGHLHPLPSEASCSCHSAISLHPPPIIAQGSSGCPCCHHRRLSNQIAEHHISRIRLATDNVTYPTPHYATAYAPLPGLHHSWEPTTSYRYSNTHHDTTNHHTEYHSHIHHHTTHHASTAAMCSDGSHFLRDDLHNFATRHFRRHSSRSSYPYPSVIHHPVTYQYPPLPRHFTSYVPYVLPPPYPAMSTFDIIGELELEAEPLEDWTEMNGRSMEPKGLKKEHIEKLPSYLVTKKTMEEFTENERCVVCMSEFDLEDNLRILPCAHEFHSECVDKWLQTNPTCPICRAVVEVT